MLSWVSIWLWRQVLEVLTSGRFSGTELVLKRPSIFECIKIGLRDKLVVKSFHFILIWSGISCEMGYVLHYWTSVEMHVFWLCEFLCAVMGKLVNIEKSLDSHQRYKPPWFRILHSSVIFWLHFRFWMLWSLFGFAVSTAWGRLEIWSAKALQAFLLCIIPHFLTGRVNF